MEGKTGILAGLEPERELERFVRESVEEQMRQRRDRGGQ